MLFVNRWLISCLGGLGSWFPLAFGLWHEINIMSALERAMHHFTDPWLDSGVTAGVTGLLGETSHSIRTDKSEWGVYFAHIQCRSIWKNHVQLLGPSVTEYAVHPKFLLLLLFCYFLFLDTVDVFNITTVWFDMALGYKALENQWQFMLLICHHMLYAEGCN